MKSMKLNMTTEQKAKAYDQVREKIALRFGSNVAEEIFSIFEESEDERIRKAIIKIVKKDEERIGVNAHLKKIQWLEKQGEQKPAVDTKVVIPKFRVGDIVKSKSQPMLSPRKIISIGKDCYWCEDRGCIGFAWEDDCEIVEQKTAWSEDDENRINRLIAYFEDKESFTAEDDVVYANWLKSLKDRVQPHSQWKPSDEQMIALQEAMNIVGILTLTGSKINSLYQDLKKLK